jgi:hypothetical protein
VEVLILIIHIPTHSPLFTFFFSNTWSIRVEHVIHIWIPFFSFYFFLPFYGLWPSFQFTLTSTPCNSNYTPISSFLPRVSWRSKRRRIQPPSQHRPSLLITPSLLISNTPLASSQSDYSRLVSRLVARSSDIKFGAASVDNHPPGTIDIPLWIHHYHHPLKLIDKPDYFQLPFNSA